MKVRLRDMVGNRAVMVLGNVTVVDRDEPTLRLDRPRSSTPHAWRIVDVSSTHHPDLPMAM